MFALVFGTLVVSISYFGMIAEGFPAMQNFTRTSAGILNLVLPSGVGTCSMDFPSDGNLPSYFEETGYLIPRIVLFIVGNHAAQDLMSLVYDPP